MELYENRGVKFIYSSRDKFIPLFSNELTWIVLRNKFFQTDQIHFTQVSFSLGKKIIDDFHSQ